MLVNIVKLLALALTNLVNLVTNMAKPSLVTNLTKPSLDLYKIWARLDTIIKQATTPPPVNFSKLETWNSYSLTAQNFNSSELVS